MRVCVNPGMCERIGNKLRTIDVLPDPYVRKPTTEEGRRREAEFWLYVIAICHSTRTLQGVIDGTWLRGGDYLLVASRRKFDSDPGFFTAERMERIKGADLRAMLSDDWNPERSTIDRVSERVGILRDCARTLSERFDGDVMRIYATSGGYLKRPDGRGILNLLREFRAYADPVEKKSSLLLLYLQESDVWKIKDPENLKVAIDYHITRVALRSGMVEITDSGLAERLRSRERATQAEDYEVREAVREACSLVSEHSGHDTFRVDVIFWNLGRSCCFYEHEPICRDKFCHKKKKCSLIKATNYRCDGKCVLNGLCLGSTEDKYRRLWETNIYTTFY